jgi:two-component system cell cycle sensor histidine kinase/response regulator CckA
MPPSQPDDDDHNASGAVTIRHRLLQRQVRKCIGGDKPVPEEWLRLIGAVDEAYLQFETDGKLTERSMELSSNELLEANSLLRRQYERDEAVIESLRTSVRTLRSKDETTPGDSTNDLLDLSNLIRDQVQLRSAAEEKIREQAALLDTANDAIYVCSLEGVIQYWNQGAERLYGWSRAETFDQPIDGFLPPDPDADGAANQALLERGTWSGERRQATKEGRSVVVYSRMTLVKDAMNRPQSAFVINTDVTEKKELEAQLLRGQRMESLGALASGIAHDLNNVLVPVVLGIQLLRTAVQNQDDLTTLRDMEASARRGADIVKQVLTFARGVEGDRLTLQPKHLLKEIEAIATNTFPKSIRIQTESAPGLWPIKGDATQLHQALMNLCINARDAMPEGGTLVLRASNSPEGESPSAPGGRAHVWSGPEPRPGPHVCLSVEDQGSGIAREIMDRIFEPFFTTKAIGKGTGLGLSTALGIVRSHGGFARVVSELGKGSSFELHFPATPGAEVRESLPVDLAHFRGQGQAILVVDDEQAVRDIATRILERFGYRVIAASGGEEGLKCFMREQAVIEAVISDMAMPGMDGPTLVKELRLVDPEVRIMGMSGHGENNGADSNSPWGLPIFLTKPFTVERLLGGLRDLLQAPAGSPSRIS